MTRESSRRQISVSCVFHHVVTTLSLFSVKKISLIDFFFCSKSLVSHSLSEEEKLEMEVYNGSAHIGKWMKAV